MDVSLLLQAIIAGVTNGLVYALVGMGMSTIFRGSKVVNAMQGEFSVIGAIEPSLRRVEIERARRKRPDSLDAWDLYLRALPFAASWPARWSAPSSSSSSCGR